MIYILQIRRRTWQTTPRIPSNWKVTMANTHYSATSLMPLDRPLSPPAGAYPAQLLPMSTKNTPAFKAKMNSSSISPSLPPNPPPTPETPPEALLSSSPSKGQLPCLLELPPSPPPSPPLSSGSTRQRGPMLEFTSGIMESKKLSSSIHGEWPPLFFDAYSKLTICRIGTLTRPIRRASPNRD